jgi:hypothetical protein
MVEISKFVDSEILIEIEAELTPTITHISTSLY